jgi:hypothetical protein
MLERMHFSDARSLRYDSYLTISRACTRKATVLNDKQLFDDNPVKLAGVKACCEKFIEFNNPKFPLTDGQLSKMCSLKSFATVKHDLFLAK